MERLRNLFCVRGLNIIFSHQAVYNRLVRRPVKFSANEADNIYGLILDAVRFDFRTGEGFCYEYEIYAAIIAFRKLGRMDLVKKFSVDHKVWEMIMLKGIVDRAMNEYGIVEGISVTVDRKKLSIRFDNQSKFEIESFKPIRGNYGALLLREVKNIKTFEGGTDITYVFVTDEGKVELGIRKNEEGSWS